METKVIKKVEFQKRVKIDRFWSIKQYPEGVILNLTVTDLNTDVELTTTILLKNADVSEMFAIVLGIYHLKIQASKLSASLYHKGNGYDVIYFAHIKCLEFKEFVCVSSDDDWLIDYVYDIIEEELNEANEEAIYEAKAIQDTEDMLNSQFK